MFAIFVTSIGAVALTGLTVSSALAQEENGTMVGNLTMGATNMTDTNMTDTNMTDTNMTNGTGNISGVEDPF